MTFQEKVKIWMLECFGKKMLDNKVERNHRFLEEALELVQSLNMSKGEAHILVDYVFSRPVGEPYQEVGGVMVTLAALCEANRLQMQENGQAEILRCWNNIRAIQDKQKTKPDSDALRGLFK